MKLRFLIVPLLAIPLVFASCEQGYYETRHHKHRTHHHKSDDPRDFRPVQQF